MGSMPLTLRRITHAAALRPLMRLAGLCTISGASTTATAGVRACGLPMRCVLCCVAQPGRHVPHLQRSQAQLERCKSLQWAGWGGRLGLLWVAKGGPRVLPQLTTFQRAHHVSEAWRVEGPLRGLQGAGCAQLPSVLGAPLGHPSKSLWSRALPHPAGCHGLPQPRHALEQVGGGLALCRRRWLKLLLLLLRVRQQGRSSHGNCGRHRQQRVAQAPADGAQELPKALSCAFGNTDDRKNGGRGDVIPRAGSGVVAAIELAQLVLLLPRQEQYHCRPAQHHSCRTAARPGSLQPCPRRCSQPPPFPAHLAAPQP